VVAQETQQVAEPAQPQQAQTWHARFNGSKAELIVFEKNCTVTEALRILAALYQKNIVPCGKVEGVLGFTRLMNVTFEEALDAVLGIDYVAQQQGSLIKVYPREEFKRIQEEAKKAQEEAKRAQEEEQRKQKLAQEEEIKRQKQALEEAKKAQEEAEKRRQQELLDPGRMVCKVFTLYYISAAEAAGLVQSVLSPNGIAKASAKADTSLPTGQSISGGAGGGDSFAFHDVLLVKDYPENVAAVEALLRQLDVRPKQVLVEATILAVRLNNGNEFGVRWDTLKGISFPDANLVGGGALMQSGLKIGICKADVGVFIKALEEITDVTLLANPKVLATNKQLGQVYIGTKLGYRDQATVSSGMATAGEVKFLDTGTKLSFRPYIGNDGYIRMDIHPKDSTGDLQTDIYGKIPSETAVELATNLLVKDGQTVVIGGLFRNKITKSKGQVPILGDLPIVGMAFKNSSDAIERQEVIVLLTPHILDEPDAAGGERAMEDLDRRLSGADRTLMPITQGRIVKDYYTKAVQAYLAGDSQKALKELDAALALQPTYLDAIRLKEQILSESSPEEYQQLDRVMLDQVRKMQD